MITALKIMLIGFVLLVMAYPFLPMPVSFRKFSTFYALRYQAPHNKRNLWFVILSFVLFVLLGWLFDLVNSAGQFIYNLPFMASLYSSTVNFLGSHINFILFVIGAVVINVIMIYLFVFAKGFLKKAVLDLIYGRAKKKEEEQKEPSGEETEDEKNDESDEKKDERVPRFEHSDEDELLLRQEEEKKEAEKKDPKKDETKQEEKKEDEEEEPGLFRMVLDFLQGLFFEGDEYQYARGWLIRVRKVLQGFIWAVHACYFVLFTTMLVATFFSMPQGLYTFLVDVIHIQDWYIYPFVSVILLQEFCNFADADAMPEEESERAEKEEKEEEIDRESRIRALRGELTRRFDSEHYLRYYPESRKKDREEYVFTNIEYESALHFIKKHMELVSGKVVQSHMECLDAIYNNNHVYFAASYYSELGEYLAAFTYIRLLSGSRMIFVVNDEAEKQTLKQHIGDRLIRMTGSNPMNTWRICVTGERLDQADVLIATPQDFRDDNVVEQYPSFFEEASNAIFLDADRMVALDGYLCLVMATRLQRACANRIRFVFLSMDLLKGFATATLPRFFCVDKVLSFSSAEENEEVSYTLWNKESKNHRIYNKNGQKLTGLECIIAELACEYGIDGVRLITESPLGHAEKKILALHQVEINNMYRPVSDVNYMIYSDERCNLSAALYACTRFRGKKKSVVHIVSKPYLLREYFMSKAVTEKYVNRSSFIQPRVTEHAQRHKLGLLRIFCEATAEKGMRISLFEEKMKNVISLALERGDQISSAFCRDLLAKKDYRSLDYRELAAYLVAALYDSETTSPEFSIGQKVKNYYLVLDPNQTDDIATEREKNILFNRVKEIFEKLFECNRRVELNLNDEVIGYLDSFPDRTHLEFIEGQSIIFDNTEYEIEHITEDGSKIILRRENSKFNNCLDTVHLRRYHLRSLDRLGDIGVLHSTKSPLEEIRVSRCRADFCGETYGFYSLTMDRQTVDFYRGVQGNPKVDRKHVRDLKDGRALKVELQCRVECTDGMRMLLAAVFNEFIKTIFPHAYRCVAIVPILTQGLPFSEETEPESEIDRIQTLYPYLVSPEGDFLETDPKRMQFLFLNDCNEDIGVLDWFYDKAARYMHEFLANVYSYLHWLKKREDKIHYIYFGGEALPECYDLDGLCDLLEGYNWILSDDGEEDYETAGNDDPLDETERCAFCHKVMESGRYALFDRHRYICAECFDVVDTKERLEEIHERIREYLKIQYPEVSFGSAKVAFDRVYDLQADQVFSEYYYRLLEGERTICVECDNPQTNAAVSILRGLIGLWQKDNNLAISAAVAQLYYEELVYLRSLDLTESADWIYENLPQEIRDGIDEITRYIQTGIIGKPEEPAGEDPSENPEESKEEKTGKEETEEEKTEEKTAPRTPEEEVVRTSFDYLFQKAKEIDDGLGDEPEGDEEDPADRLYKPSKMPRFWKRYLKHQKIDDGKEEDVTDAKGDESQEEEPNPEGSEGEENGTGELPQPEERKKKGFWFFNRPEGDKIAPHEPEEDSNPYLHFYNEIVRAAYNFSEAPISRAGISNDMMNTIFYYVKGDYPEIFWVECYAYNATHFQLVFRCKDAYGKLDLKQIKQKRAALRKATKPFIKGISRRTDPYEALLTLYRRIILTLDYDGQGLDMGVDRDLTKDDTLRSLYSAIVEHKVVCAGYAVAMQYLLQAAGIVSACVISECNAAGTSCHAFNMVKIGKYVYYLDPTWGDTSNTKTGDANADLVLFNYCCVPYREFLQADPSSRHNHIPRKEFYPDLGEMQYTNHEYFRYHNAYLTRYNAEQIIQVMSEAALAYDPKEMGDFVIGFRCVDEAQMDYIHRRLTTEGEIFTLAAQAAEIAKKKNKKAAKLLEFQQYSYLPCRDTATVYYILATKK